VKLKVYHFIWHY